MIGWERIQEGRLTWKDGFWVLMLVCMKTICDRTLVCMKNNFFSSGLGMNNNTRLVREPMNFLKRTSVCSEKIDSLFFALFLMALLLESYWLHYITLIPDHLEVCHDPSSPNGWINLNSWPGFDFAIQTTFCVLLLNEPSTPSLAYVWKSNTIQISLQVWLPLLILPMYLALIIRLFCYKVDITVDPKMSVITRFQSTIFWIKFSGATAVYQESVGEVVSLETNQAWRARVYDSVDRGRRRADVRKRWRRPNSESESR